MLPVIDIDDHSGFCFGVVTAITKAEQTLEEGEPLYCLGDIVHNSDEINRLTHKGLITISHSELQNLRGVRVLLRAHGEPPSTYIQAEERDISLIDATCPVVLKLQQRIKKAYEESRDRNLDLQIVIYGQRGHAEVNGLVGQTEGTAIVVENPDQLDNLDFSRDIALYSQTTKSIEGFKGIIDIINRRISPDATFKYYDTICRQVANRVEFLKEFASTHDIILFVSGKKSSNGKVLYEHCRSVNKQVYMLSNPDDLKPEWLKGARTIGICGATSTPRWLMENVALKVRTLSKNSD